MATRSASSLALLQERFNKLQKTREMRQEKELLRFISHAAANMHYKQPANPCHYYDSDELLMFQKLPPSSPVGLSDELVMFQRLQPPSLVVRAPPPPAAPISHRPVTGDDMEEEEEEIAKSLLFGTKNLLGLYNSGSSSPHFKFERHACTPLPDVDTSLHL